MGVSALGIISPGGNMVKLSKRLRLTATAVRGVAAIVIFFILIGCMAASVGKFKQNREVDTLFKSGQVLSGHTYYYAGSMDNPDAILAIQPSYTLDDDSWVKIDDIHKHLDRWVRQMGRHWSLSGYDILAPDGSRIGIYYSPWDNGLIIMEADNRVTIYPPDREAYRLWLQGPPNE